MMIEKGDKVCFKSDAEDLVIDICEVKDVIGDEILVKTTVAEELIQVSKSKLCTINEFIVLYAKQIIKQEMQSARYALDDAETKLMNFKRLEEAMQDE